MQQLKILKRKEVKQLLAKIKEQWGYSKSLDYAFLRSSKDKIYIVNKDFAKIDISKLKIDKIGLYFCTVVNKNEIRLSIEGSQIVGPYATKNIIELSRSEMKEWLQGVNIEKDVREIGGFAIIKYDSDFMGTGKVKEGKILNYIPKARRIKISL